MVTRLVIDTCCLLNLLASRLAVEITSVLDLELVATPHVRREALSLRGGFGEKVEKSGTPADLSQLEAAGRLRFEPLEGPAIESFVRCIEHLHEVDAAAVALAATLGLALATDDTRQRNVARRLFPELELRSTLSLLRPALAGLGLSREQSCAVARDVRTRANFLPPKWDPDREWFLELLAGAL